MTSDSLIKGPLTVNVQKYKPQMKITKVVPVSRKKNNGKLENRFIPTNSKNCAHITEDFNNIVFSGTAKRKPIEEKENNSAIKNVRRNNFKESLMKLRAPFCKPYQKQGREKIMTKSCETLFACIKPYKDISITKKTKVAESQSIGKFLRTTDIIYEWKATRKVEFFSFSEEKPMQKFFLKHKALLSATDLSDFDNNIENCEVFDEREMSPNHTNKTVSSEDFIISVLSEPEVALN